MAYWTCCPRKEAIVTDISTRMNPYLTDEYNGVGFQERPIQCPSCGKDAAIRIFYFVDVARCPTFMDAVQDGWVERNECPHCHKCIRSRSPLIAFFPIQKLLVFATHGRDDGGVEAGFRQWLAFVKMVLPSEIFGHCSRNPGFDMDRAGDHQQF